MLTLIKRRSIKTYLAVIMYSWNNTSPVSYNKHRDGLYLAILSIWEPSLLKCIWQAISHQDTIWLSLVEMEAYFHQFEVFQKSWQECFFQMSIAQAGNAREDPPISSEWQHKKVRRDQDPRVRKGFGVHNHRSGFSQSLNKSKGRKGPAFNGGQ